MTRRLSWSFLFAVAVVFAAPGATAAAQQARPDSSSVRAPLSAPVGAPVVRAARQSWTADRMPLAIGDIITVNVDEHLLASADRKNAADDQRSRSLGFAAAQGPTGLGPQASINSENNGHSQVEGQASRTNDFVGAITARVVAVSPTGLLQVKGTKLVELDKSKEELAISGWIRPDDVSPTNTIESWRIADAQLTYHATGDIDKPKGHLLLRILGALWP